MIILTISVIVVVNVTMTRMAHCLNLIVARLMLHKGH